jgi:hypothetical protein
VAAEVGLAVGDALALEPLETGANG